MKSAKILLSDNRDTLPRMPSWVSSASAAALEDVAFMSGAALSALHLAVTSADVPHALVRERLALRSAEACVALSGRPERARDLRDAVHFLRPGDQPGPAGDVYQTWRRAVARKISVKTLQRALPTQTSEQVATWLDTAQGGPVVRAAAVLELILSEHPREEVMALILADAVLAQSLGWKYVMPILAAGLKPRDVRLLGSDLQLACHKAVVSSGDKAMQIASDLSLRADRLRAITPKLRAKGAGAAIALFLSKDALSPSAALADLMSDRAARRLCDRLVAFGLVRELTGRATFRLYGV